jgi:hypothetical protein
MGCFAFWFFYEVCKCRCYVGADGLVSSSLGGLSEKIKNLFGRNSCVVCFFCDFMCINLLFFWRSAVGSLVMFLLVILY